MKKSLVLMFGLFFLHQPSNLEAMKQKLSFAGGPYAQLRKNVDREAQEALSNITEWLTFEFIEEMLMLKINGEERRFSETSDIPTDEIDDDDDDISDPFLDLKRIDSLSIGQRVVLTCWQKYPCYAAQVMQVLRALKPQDSSTLSELLCIELFKRLMIAHNFGSDVALMIQKYEQDDDVKFCLRISEKIERFLSFFKNAITEKWEKDELLEKIDPDFLRLLFILRYPYFFEKFILASYLNKQDKIIELFLEYGFDPNYLFIYNYPGNILYGATLLYAAVADKRDETVLLLLSWGADPECEDLCGISPWRISLNQMRCLFNRRAYKINALLKQCLSEETKKVLEVAA